MPLPQPDTSLSRRDVIRLFLDEIGPTWCRAQTAHQIACACNVWKHFWKHPHVDVDSGEARSVLEQRGIEFHKPGRTGHRVPVNAAAMRELKARFTAQAAQLAQEHHMTVNTNTVSPASAAPVTQPATAPVPENAFDVRIKQLNAETAVAFELLRVCGGEPARAKKVLDNVLSIAE